MFLFTFTKLRKRIFVALLTAFIVVPLFILFVFWFRTPVFLGGQIFEFAFLGIMFYFFLPALLTWAVFGYGHFFAGGIGVGPNGAGGVIITLIFYIAVAFLLSLVGNFKKDAEDVRWKEAISKRYLKKLFLIIAGILVLVLLLSGLERLLLFPKQVKDVEERLKDEQIPVRIESIIQQGVENLPVQMLQFQKEPISVTEEEYDRMLSSYKVEFDGGVTASVGPVALLLSSFYPDTGESYSNPSVWIKLALLPIPNIDLNDFFAQIRADKVLNANSEDVKNTTASDDGKLITGAGMFKSSETPAPHFTAHKAVYLAKGVKNKDEISRVEGALTIKLPVELKSFTLDLPAEYSQGEDNYFAFSINEDMNGKYTQIGLTDFTNDSFTIRYLGIADNLLFPIAYGDNGEHIRLYPTASVAESEKIPWSELRYSYSGKIQTLKVFVASRIIERSYPFVLAKNTAPIAGTSLDKKSCNELEKDIGIAIEDVKYCATDSDCTITQFGVCPFGCYSLVNKDADTFTIKNMLGAYTSRCPECIYQCPVPPAPEEIYCRNNKCVDGRNDVNPKPQAIDLKSIYLAYASAVHSEDLDKMYQYLTYEVQESIKKAFAGSDMKERKGLFEFLKLSAPFQPDSVKFGAQVIENDKGILRIETEEKQTNQYSKVQNPRNYGTIFFIEENNEWKMDKQYFISYKDPTLLLSEDINNPITFFWHPQFHANHTISPAECARETTWSDHCYWSWAVLNRDPSLCGKIFDDSGTDKIQGYHSLQRFNCFQDLAQLTGDQNLCELTGSDRIKTDEFFASRVRSCKNSVSYRDFFINTNIYTIDSDDDGLTDMQEAYFNTSLVNADTDYDGANDAQEVKNDQNPLGNGKLWRSPFEY